MHHDEWDFWAAMTSSDDVCTTDDPLALWLWHTCMAMRYRTNGHGNTRAGRNWSAEERLLADKERRRFLG